MKQRIIIISDLWGAKKSSWLASFQELLSKEYEIIFYDSCILGEVDLSKYDEKNIHTQFVNFGIEKAVNTLLTLHDQPEIYIGCSIGGVIAWKAGLKGLKIKNLITISATRLRFEKAKPNCPLEIYFGNNDLYKPDIEWMKCMGETNIRLLDGGHDIYKKKTKVQEILNWLKEIA